MIGVILITQPIGGNHHGLEVVNRLSSDGAGIAAVGKPLRGNERFRIAKNRRARPHGEIAKAITVLVTKAPNIPT